MCRPGLAGTQVKAFLQTIQRKLQSTVLLLSGKTCVLGRFYTWKHQPQSLHFELLTLSPTPRSFTALGLPGTQSLGQKLEDLSLKESECPQSKDVSTLASSFPS